MTLTEHDVAELVAEGVVDAPTAERIRAYMRGRPAEGPETGARSLPA